MTTLVADRARDSERPFLASHPWMRYELDLQHADRLFWQLLGEAKSKCRHLMLTPLKPATANELQAVYLTKGMQATTAIEGNTLTEQQVRGAVEGTLRVPPSQEYLKQEVDNVLEGTRQIEMRIADTGGFVITPDDLRALNGMVLRDLEVEDHVVPGEYRDIAVGVGNYAGAPQADVPFLTELLCDWLNGDDFAPPGLAHRDAFLFAFLRAVAAHIYIAWIHPFGDGNGRTARLVEFGILTAAGIPSVAAHLLSNHYNKTRAVYYRQLDRASASGGDLAPYLLYAVEGFVDLLQEQLDVVHQQMFDIAWENLVHEHYRGRPGDAVKRQRDLVIELGRADKPVPRSGLPGLSGALAAAYAAATPKTLTRDINAIAKTGLVAKVPAGYVARRAIMYAFLPAIGGAIRDNVLMDLSGVDLESITEESLT